MNYLIVEESRYEKEKEKGSASQLVRGARAQSYRCGKSWRQEERAIQKSMPHI